MLCLCHLFGLTVHKQALELSGCTVCFSWSVLLHHVGYMHKWLTHVTNITLARGCEYFTVLPPPPFFALNFAITFFSLKQEISLLLSLTLSFLCLVSWNVPV